MSERILHKLDYAPERDRMERMRNAALEMYQMLVKILDDTQNGQFADENKLIALLNAIDGQDREFNYMYPIIEETHYDRLRDDE
ncbi:MAG: hypothetical protein IJ587_10990 [Synergistaceae bacterium]|nr:hypothetical protein [Synergistaceae bacterium]